MLIDIVGIHPNLSNDDYHAHDSVSRSKLMDFAESPYRYWAMHVNPNRPPKKETKAFEIGQALHDLVLQPELFKKEYEIEPKKVFLKDVGRHEYDEYKAKCKELEESGKIILSDEDFVKLKEMQDRLMSHKFARELIENAIYESSYFWIDKESGLLVKTKPDILHYNMNVDFKTTRNASSHAFRNSIAEYGYHIQAAFVRDARRELEGRDVPNFLNVGIEKEYPYHIGVYLLEEEAIDHGEKVYKQHLLNLKEAIAINEWDDYPVETIGLPHWAY